jgi:hypothetical protein
MPQGTPDREDWELVVRELLYFLFERTGPFTPQNLYRADIAPWDNDALNAKIDLERSLEAGCRSASEIVEFLHCVEEGWFFDARAWLFGILRDFGLYGNLEKNFYEVLDK